MNKKATFTLKLNENNIKKAKNFFSKYELLSMFGDSEEKFILGNENQRICRFCKKSDKETKFKKDAHVIPEFMGNHNLLSFFECDSCNELFAKYEDSFANFVGINRTITQIKGKKNKIPKYKDPRTGLEMFVNEEAIQITAIEGTDVFEMDEKNKSFTLKTKRPGYIPIHIPKILIKIGLSMLLEDELDDYDYTRKFLIDREKESQFKDSNTLRIFGYFIPGPPKFNKPFVQLYRRIDNEFKTPFYQMIFYYANYQLQMTLPFGEKDKHLQGEKVDLPIAPLLIDNSHLEKYGQERFLNLNLTADIKTSGEDNNITFSFDKLVETDLKK